MIRIFRQARSMTTSRKHFRKFLWYSLGEIFLVVIGILIAIQVNNWNEDRLKNKKLESVLVSLQHEFSNNMHQLEEVIWYQKRIESASNRLLVYIANPPASIPKNGKSSTPHFSLTCPPKPRRRRITRHYSEATNSPLAPPLLSW